MPEFASRVAGKLSMHRVASAHQGNSPGEDRNPEDMYDISDVMDIAKQTSLEYANPFGKFILSTPGTNSKVGIKLEAAVAKLTDTINLQSQYNKQVEQRLSTLQTYMTQPRAPTFGGTGLAAQQGYN